ncbi:MAG: SIS domain-containing protein [Acidobacteriota bacterium]
MNFIDAYIQKTQQALSKIPSKQLCETILLLFKAWKSGSQVFIFGNGGSASTASHMANDLSKATIVPGKPRMRVIALTDNISMITAWANDAAYEDIFKEQLENLLQPGDVIVAISAGGNSPNVLRAIEFARQQGAVTIGWTGLSGGRLKDAVDHCVQAPTDDVGMVESIHLVLDHLITVELRMCIQTGREPSVNGRSQREKGKNARRPRVVSLAAGRGA